MSDTHLACRLSTVACVITQLVWVSAVARLGVRDRFLNCPPYPHGICNQQLSPAFDLDTPDYASLWRGLLSAGRNALRCLLAVRMACWGQSYCDSGPDL